MYIEEMETHQVYALCTGAKSPGIQMRTFTGKH